MSFLQDFMLYNAGNECPRPYVLWTGYGLLSAAMGRRCHVDLGWKWTTADIFILLIGPSGGKKSAALDIGKTLLIEAIPDVVFSGDNETYQGIITYMHDDKSTRFFKDSAGGLVPYKPYCIFSSELMGYLELNPIAMVNFLTTIYGLKAYQYKLKHETYTLENPFVMMCACSIPEWLTDQIKAKQFASGYGRRSIIVCSQKMQRIKPFINADHLAARVRCVDRLKAIQNLSGKMIITPDAEAWFWDWYTHLKDPDDTFIRNWYSTIDMNLLKLAMLTSISERDDKVITIDHMKLVLGLLKEVEKELPMVTERLGRSELVEPSLQVMQILKNHNGRYPEKQLKMDTLRCFKDTREQWSVLEWLKGTDQIEVKVDENKITWLCLKVKTKQ